MGNVGALAIDDKDHIWVVHRPGSLTGLSETFGMTGESECCYPAPPVLEFDAQGNVVQSWGPIHDKDGKLVGKQVWGPFPDVEWPLSEHGIYVDDQYVWIGAQSPPSQLLKFSRDGRFVMRIGRAEAATSNDTDRLGGPTQMFVRKGTNELFVADGYRNRRVIVFDSVSGTYLRHWGAYGTKPTDGPLGGTPVEGKYQPGSASKQFATVHCAVMTSDQLVYICDRVNNRIQVFRPDGTFVREAFIAPKTLAFGAVQAIGVSPDERFMYVADGANKKVWIVRRSDLSTVGSFGSGGRMGGQIMLAHALVVDRQGNVYVGETVDNNRVQKFAFKGMTEAPRD